MSVTDAPYPDAAAHLRDELRLLDARLRRRLVATGEAEADGVAGHGATNEAGSPGERSVAAEASTDGPGERNGAGQIGPTDSVGTTDAAGLDEPLDADTRSERAGPDPDDECRRLRSVIDRRVAASRRSGVDLPLPTLASRFGLTTTGRDALVVGAAAALDPDYGSLFGYLQDGLVRRPTVGLVVDLLAGADGDRPAVRELFARDAPLRGGRLVGLADDSSIPRLDRPVVVDERIADHLRGVDTLPTALADCCAATTPTGRIDDLPVDDVVRDRIGRLGAGAWDESESGSALVHLSGPPGVGTERAVAAICAEAGVGRLLTYDAGGLVPTGGDGDERRLVAVERAGLLVRESRLRDCPVHLSGVETLLGAGDSGGTDGRTGGRGGSNAASETAGGGSRGRRDRSVALLAAVIEALDDADGPVFTSGTTDLPPAVRTRPTRHAVASCAMPTPGFEGRRRQWRTVPDLPSTVDPDTLAATFRLTAGGIDEAVALARTYLEVDPAESVERGADTAGRTDDGRLTRESVYAGCRAVTAAALGDNATKVEPTAGWDDIVLLPEPARKLRAVGDRIGDDGRVYDDWGFAVRYGRGGGTAVLFTGPSGTGKTMAAEVLARESGRDLYRVDLSSVVSKYVGETEKRLGAVFDGAAGSSAILLFDEADALFGKRSQVSDAHDRYANVETNYLLQRIEAHDGVVLLTSNFPENIDDAFRRRLHLTVSFPRPDDEARETIWRRVFPPATPVGALDYPFLASFELTGGDVKNAALTAAFLAAREEREGAGDDREDAHADGAGEDAPGRVEMRHVVPAVRDELRKTGSLVDPDAFGDYWELMAG